MTDDELVEAMWLAWAEHATPKPFEVTTAMRAVLAVGREHDGALRVTPVPMLPDDAHAAALAAERALRVKAEQEAAKLRADAGRWRTVSAMMTHEHRGDAVGWTLSVLLPGDDPDVAADAAIAARVGDEP